MSRTSRSLAVMLMAALSSWSCGSTEPGGTAQSVVAAVVVTPSTSTLAINAQLPLQAQVQDASGTIIPDAAVTWTVQDPKVVSVSPAGVVTALAIGTSQVAASALGKSGIATITVQKTPVASVVLVPGRVDVTVGGTYQLTAVALDASGNTMSDRAIIWSSSNPGVASVNGSGLVTAVSAGTATITAASEGKTSTTSIAVAQGSVARVDVTPATLSMQTGQTQQLVATAKDAKGNVLGGKTVVWASDNSSVATVNNGSVSALAAGTAVITATVDGVSGRSDVSVTLVPVKSISVAPSTASMSVGDTKTLTATVIDANGNPTSRTVTWSTNAPSVATVDPSTGLVKAVGVGSATITAAIGSINGSSTITVSAAPIQSVTVSPPSLSLTVGQTGNLAAAVVDATGATLSNPSVAWTTSDPSIATVSTSGVVTAVAIGSATITATSGGKSGSSSVAVAGVPIASVTISPSTSTVTAGQTKTLTATVKDANGNVVTGSTVTWTSSDVQIASPTSTGATTADVTTSKSGTATITASIGGVQGTASITVNPGAVSSVSVTAPSANLKVGTTMQLSATALDSEGNTVPNQSFTWSSSNNTLATVSSSGVVLGRKAGTVTITAATTSLLGSKSGSVTITVK